MTPIAGSDGMLYAIGNSGCRTMPGGRGGGGLKVSYSRPVVGTSGPTLGNSTEGRQRG